MEGRRLLFRGWSGIEVDKRPALEELTDDELLDVWNEFSGDDATFFRTREGIINRIGEQLDRLGLEYITFEQRESESIMAEKEKTEKETKAKEEKAEKVKKHRGEADWKDLPAKAEPKFEMRRGEKGQRRLKTLELLSAGCTLDDIKALPGVTNPVAHIVKMHKEFGYGVQKDEKTGKFHLVDKQNKRITFKYDPPPPKPPKEKKEKGDAKEAPAN